MYQNMNLFSTTSSSGFSPLNSEPCSDSFPSLPFRDKHLWIPLLYTASWALAPPPHSFSCRPLMTVSLFNPTGPLNPRFLNYAAIITGDIFIPGILSFPGLCDSPASRWILLPSLRAHLLIHLYKCSAISFPFNGAIPTGPILTLLSLSILHMSLGTIFHSCSFKLLLLYDFQISLSRSQLGFIIFSFVLVIFTKFSMNTSNSTRPTMNSSATPKPLKKKKNSLSWWHYHLSMTKNMNYSRPLSRSFHSIPISN